MSGSRERILARLGNGSSEDSRTPSPSTTFKGTDLWATFEEFFTALGGKMIPFGQVQHYVHEGTFIDPKAVQIIHAEPSQIDIWEAKVGISVAEFAIAETGSLVVTASAETFRGSSLVPPLNIVLVRRSSIVATLAEAMTQMPATSSAIISGPSRTADIEGVLVRGIHGPSELMVAIYD